ncbi:MAG: GatB/YqeY domain-containing protein [Firmicutes bacterium]|nr:GatB/YqeY domain-containing protein [Bacillota bacterium]
MGLPERIQKELTEAMKARDELRLRVLRMVKTALHNRQVEKMRPLDEAEAVQVLQTLVKQRREAIEQFAKGGRADLVATETRELALLESYLPAPPTQEELDAAIQDAIREIGAASPKQMGAVIKAARERLAGKAVDGKVLADRVRAWLSQPG